ncbi:hypothetical protein XGA_4973 [Xanthomonas hortorum ATCC 19865]|nr:hypothetical protein XGA_4973 [Xanthomonas hortorum ATCC 19865]
MHFQLRGVRGRTSYQPSALRRFQDMECIRLAHVLQRVKRTERTLGAIAFDDVIQVDRWHGCALGWKTMSSIGATRGKQQLKAQHLQRAQD